MPSLMPRMATTNSANGHPTPTQRTMLFQGINSIGGTGRSETTALTYPWTENNLIATHQEDQ